MYLLYPKYPTPNMSDLTVLCVGYTLERYVYGLKCKINIFYLFLSYLTIILVLGASGGKCSTPIQEKYLNVCLTEFLSRRYMEIFF